MNTYVLEDAELLVERVCPISVDCVICKDKDGRMHRIDLLVCGDLKGITHAELVGKRVRISYAHAHELIADSVEILEDTA